MYFSNINFAQLCDKLKCFYELFYKCEPKIIVDGEKADLTAKIDRLQSVSGL